MKVTSGELERIKFLSSRVLEDITKLLDNLEQTDVDYIIEDIDKIKSILQSLWK
jgi:hypothetical protein